MVKIFKKWPEMQIDKPILEFFQRHGIDPNDVRSWRITRTPADLPLLEVTFFYQEPEPVQADVTGIDKPPGSEFLPTTS